MLSHYKSFVDCALQHVPEGAAIAAVAFTPSAETQGMEKAFDALTHFLSALCMGGAHGRC